MVVEKKYNFVYLTTNLIDGKQYVGDHSSDNLDHSKTKNYLGSGKYIQRAVKLHSKENFKRDILEFFETKQEVFDAQAKFINEYNTLVPNGYNISPMGGMQVFEGCSVETAKQISVTKKSQHLVMPEEQKLKISKALEGVKKPPRTKEHSDKISKAKKGKVPWNKGVKMSKEFCENVSKRLTGKPSNMSGKKHRPESIEKLKKTLKNKRDETKG